MEKLLVAPFTKIDAEQRTVSGYATLEVPDADGEIVDYESAKAAFQHWVGNIREMHLPIAVGKAIEVVPDDAKRGIYLSAKISQSRDGQDAWTKIQEQVLTGFSIGMKGLTKTPETITVDGKPVAVKRIRFKTLAETSLADNPACPGTQFDTIKAVLPDPAGSECAPEAVTLPAGAKTLLAEGMKATETADIHRALETLHLLLELLRSKQMDAVMGEAKAPQLAGLRQSFESVHAFVAQELGDLMAPPAEDGAQRTAAAEAAKAAEAQTTAEAQRRTGAETKAVRVDEGTSVPSMASVAPASGAETVVTADTTKVILAAADSLKAMLADALKDLAGKADLLPLSEGVQQATAAAEAVKADLATVAKRVETLEKAPAPGGPALRPADLAAKGLMVVDKGGAPDAAAQSATAKAVLADLEKQLDNARDPYLRDKLGQIYTTLALKYGAL